MNKYGAFHKVKINWILLHEKCWFCILKTENDKLILILLPMLYWDSLSSFWWLNAYQRKQQQQQKTQKQKQTETKANW